MNIISISEENYQELKRQLAEIHSKLQQLKPNDEYWDNADVIQKLKVSERTLATWREKGMIRYSKVGNKVFYRHQDIMQFLDDYSNEPSSKKSTK